jgi:hypothetical protein
MDANKLGSDLLIAGFTCRLGDLLGDVLDLLKILQRLREVLHSVPKVFEGVLELFFRGIEVCFGVVLILARMCGIRSTLGKIANGVAEILNKMFE